MNQNSAKTSIRPIVFILVLSIVLMMVLFFVQSRSDKSIRAMQHGNELAVKTFQINNILQDIINNTYFLESQTRKKVTAGDIQLSKNISDSIVTLQKQVTEVAGISASFNLTKMFGDLGVLVDRKILLTKSILNKNTSPADAKLKITSNENKNLIDSIYLAASDIQIEAEKELQNTIIENSTVSNQVLVNSRALIIFALITILLSATLIIRHLIQKSKLIDELEEAKEKANLAASSKEQFLANMSHEIRTPLNSIIGFSNLANKTKLDGEQKDYISFIKSSGENLLYIINDILDFSKLEAGKLQISKAPFNLKEICHFIEMLFQVQLAEKKIYFSVQLEENIPLYLTGDDDRLKQILTNLVSNAIKFTGIGGNITLKVSTAKKEDGLIYIQFAVKDSGIGIPEDKLKTVFERFEQADSATTRKYGGTGLGLSIVKQLVTLQNGTIEVKSKENVGSEFITVIPYSINMLASDSTENAEEIQTVKNYQLGSRILIAEDNKLNQLLIQSLFKNWGLSIQIAKDGNEAIEFLEKNTYDLVMLDIQMPFVDGYGVVKWIREIKKSSLPVIAMTAHTMPTEIKKCQEAGMDDYLPKPLDEENIVRLFNKYIPKIDQTMNNAGTELVYVDLLNMQKLFGNDTQIIADLLQLFSTQYTDELIQLSAAYESRNMGKVYSVAHNLKTTVSSLKANSSLLYPLLEIEKYKSIEPDWNVIDAQIHLLTGSKETVLLEINTLQKKLLN